VTPQIIMNAIKKIGIVNKILQVHTLSGKMENGNQGKKNLNISI